MKMNTWMAVGLAVVASTVSSVAGYIGTTSQAGNPSAELEKLMTLINYDTPPGLAYTGTSGDPSVSYESGGVVCEISFITKDDTGRGTSFTLTDLGFLNGYDSILAGVKYGRWINWFAFSPEADSVTFTTGVPDVLKAQDISHITYFGMICEEEDAPSERVSDSGSMVALLGGGLLGLAGIRRRLNR